MYKAFIITSTICANSQYIIFSQQLYSLTQIQDGTNATWSQLIVLQGIYHVILSKDVQV
jgi:hypothetical protein